MFSADARKTATPGNLKLPLSTSHEKGGRSKGETQKQRVFPAMAKLVILSGSLAGTELELREGRNSVGRTPENDLTIPEDAISHHHCDLWVNDDQWRVHDLHSKNGTFLHGRRVRTAELKDGDVLILGDIAVRLETPSPEVRIPEREPVSDEPQPTVLEDGRPACLRHPELPAVYACD